MYHFVGDVPNHLPSLKTFATDAFCDQLDQLCEKYEPFYLHKYLENPDSFKASTTEKFILTFDHGTIDHFEVVLPELKKRDLVGYFYIMTSVPEEWSIPIIDKQRYVESYFSSYEDFYDLFREFCVKKDPSLEKVVNPSEENLNSVTEYLKRFSFYSRRERLFRKIRDLLLSKENFEDIFNRLFEELFGSEEEFAKKSYMSWQNIKKLQSEGMIVGSHGHNHVLYSEEQVAVSVDDIKTSFSLLRQRLDNASIDSLAYPNGGNNAALYGFLNENNVNWAFATHTDIVFRESMMLNLGRIDATQCFCEK